MNNNSVLICAIKIICYCNALNQKIIESHLLVSVHCRFKQKIK